MNQKEKPIARLLKETVANNLGLPLMVIDGKFKSLQLNKKAVECFKGLSDPASLISMITSTPGNDFRKNFDQSLKTGKEKTISVDIKGSAWKLKMFASKSSVTILFEKQHSTKRQKDFFENRMLLDSMGDNFMLTDGNQTVVDANEAVCKALGYSRSEIIGMNTSVFDTKLSDKDLRIIHKHASKKALTFDTININRKGKIVYTEVNMFPIVIDGKKYYGSIGRDITEYKELQKELEESNRKLSNITNATNDALWEVNEITGERWANEIHQQLYGLKKSDPMPTSQEWENHIHPGDRKKTISGLNDAVRNHHTTWNTEYRFRVRKNKWIYIYDRTLIYYDKDGNLEKMMGSMVDITELKLAQEELQTQRDLSEGIINALPGIFYLLDKNGKFIRWNTNFETVTGFTPEEIKKMKPADFLYTREAQKLSENIEEVFTTGWAEMEGTLLNKSGLGTPYYLSGWRTSVGNQECLIGTGVDLSELKKAQDSIKRMELKITEQKIQDQKVISRAIISAQEKERNHIAKELHDNVNQLLAGTRLYLTMGAKKDPGYGEMVKYPIELLDKGIHEIRVLTHHHISPAKDTDLKQMAEGVATLLKAASIQCKLEYALDEEIPENLLINIYRILQEETHNILKHSKAKNVTIKINSRGGSIFISIADDGRGFDIHKQREGIGISNIFNRVESYNGIIEITSSPGKGCKTEIEIPVPDYVSLALPLTNGGKRK